MAVREKSKRSFRHIAMGWASIEVKLSLLSQCDAPSFYSPKTNESKRVRLLQSLGN